FSADADKRRRPASREDPDAYHGTGGGQGDMIVMLSRDTTSPWKETESPGCIYLRVREHRLSRQSRLRTGGLVEIVPPVTLVA
ncbi:hypothetical protein, partial [Streptomyces sp. Tue6028]|uniref:hypothetical protein n=1 Tax=Streptomyces sp. Tue6028 TaxID=2036037 RepID=UPI003D75453E